MMIRAHLGHVDVKISRVEPLVITRWGDGVELLARPHPTADYEERARSLGYRDGRALNAEHDLTHAELAVLLGLPWSPTLRAVARRQAYDGMLAGMEEDAVLAIQRLKNALRQAGTFLDTPYEKALRRSVLS